ncbi:hypothetical protein BJ138DRAFT_1095812 [Hygrophoropsis aurantiaca]|uniref:Uncharacterized protein n=1 Tax=Hygrophoropsis aurantiaca TaxID=72124 RepID=A0ACB7ZVT4_9AGAM|nr:hypothetical protein BJ138DRAFT_1095812 [Hygrophoropsis aurantiaca]
MSACEEESSSFFSNLLKPGSSLNPNFLLVVDCAFALLLVVFIISAYLTSGNAHFFVLMAIEVALWGTVKWFVDELKKLPVNSDTTEGEKKQQ